MFFRQLIAGLIRGQVTQRLLSAAQQTTKGEALPQTDIRPRKKRPQIAIVFALGIEAGGTKELLKDAEAFRGRAMHGWFGSLEERQVYLAISGAGPRAAERTAKEILSDAAPQHLISAGFAGGLSPEFAQGDILLADRVGNSAGEEISLAIEWKPTPRPQGPILRRGKLLTVEQIVRTPAEKRQLFDTSGALACDMETFAIARSCQGSGTQVHSLRIISDTRDDELPREVGHLLNQKSTAGKLGALAGSLFRRPAVAKDLWRLQQQASGLAGKLATFIREMVGALPS